MPGDQRCIVIVDDDAGMNKALNRLLRSAGYHTCSFHSAEEFLGHFEEQRWDCLILDIRLPGISGVELSQRLESEDKHLPTVFITGQPTDWEREQARTPLRGTCLYKPFSDSLLLETVIATLGSHSQPHQNNDIKAVH